MASVKVGKSKAIRQDQGKGLPVIVIEGIKDIAMSEMRLRMNDETFRTIVKVGIEEVTDKDFFEIGFRYLITETLKRKKFRAKS